MGRSVGYCELCAVDKVEKGKTKTATPPVTCKGFVKEKQYNYFVMWFMCHLIISLIDVTINQCVRILISGLQHLAIIVYVHKNISVRFSYC